MLPPVQDELGGAGTPPALGTGVGERQTKKFEIGQDLFTWLLIQANKIFGYLR